MSAIVSEGSQALTQAAVTTIKRGQRQARPTKGRIPLPVAWATPAGGAATHRRFQSRQIRAARPVSVGWCICTTGQAPTCGGGRMLRLGRAHTLTSSLPIAPKLVLLLCEECR
jgi:hypothetical protein